MNTRRHCKYFRTKKDVKEPLRYLAEPPNSSIDGSGFFSICTMVILLLCSATKQNLTMFRNETILAGKYTTSMLLTSSLGDYHIYQS